MAEVFIDRSRASRETGLTEFRLVDFPDRPQFPSLTKAKKARERGRSRIEYRNVLGPNGWELWPESTVARDQYWPVPSPTGQEIE